MLIPSVLRLAGFGGCATFLRRYQLAVIRAVRRVFLDTLAPYGDSSSKAGQCYVTTSTTCNNSESRRGGIEYSFYAGAPPGSFPCELR